MGAARFPHPFLRDHTVVRRLREAAFSLESSNKTIILLGPVLKIPPELEKEITVVDFSLYVTSWTANWTVSSRARAATARSTLP